MDEAWVISDLHLGDGIRPGLEDFRDDAVLGEWLGERARPTTTLVINGDFIEFLQIPVEPVPGPPLPPWALWDEATSVEKVRRSIAGHASVFDALAAFVARGASLRFTIGNHDLDLWWPGVQAAIRQRLGDAEQRVTFDLQYTLFGCVHVEHGHRFTGENKPKDFARFVHVVKRDGVPDIEVLECVWGSRFMLDALNPLEMEFPYIDNVKPTWKLAALMLRDGDWVKGRAKTLLDLIRFFRRTGIPLRDLTDELRAHEPSEFDTAMASLSVEERVELGDPTVIEVAEPDGLEVEASETTDRAASEPAAAGAWDLGRFRERREIRGARTCLKRDGITHVVLGHTHDVIDGWEDVLWNPGSWIEHLDMRTEAWRAQTESRSLRDLVTDPTLFTTDPRAVHISFDGEHAKLSLEEVRADT